MKKLIFSLCLLFLLTGCGPRLVYPHLDWLIPFYVDDYISLNRKQGSMLEKRLLQVLDWHCRTQLPAYAQSLRELAKDLEKLGQVETLDEILEAGSNSLWAILFVVFGLFVMLFLYRFNRIL